MEEKKQKERQEMNAKKTSMACFHRNWDWMVLKLSVHI